MAHPNKTRSASTCDIIHLYLLQQKFVYMAFTGTVKLLSFWYFCAYLCFCGCRFACSHCSGSWCVSVSLLFTSLYTKICHCVRRPRWQVTMPLAEGGPSRTSSPLGTEPRIELLWGSLNPITRSTNMRRRTRNTPAKHILRSNRG